MTEKSKTFLQGDNVSHTDPECNNIGVHMEVLHLNRKIVFIHVNFKL